MILPFDHIRVFRRSGKIKPILIREPMGILDTLIEVYKDHIDNKRGLLSSVVSDCEYLGYNFKLVRGLASILDSRSVFRSKSVISPLEARRQVFSLANQTVVASNEDRQAVLVRVAERNSITVDELDNSLYSDLEDEQYLEDFKDLSSEDLSLFYNYAHTVAMLAYSTRVELSFKGDDSYLDRVFFGLGSEEQKRSSMNVVKLKPTTRLSQRASKFDDIMSRLLEKEGWLLRADIKYPARYKSTCVFEIDSRGDGRLLKTDPFDKEFIIEIPLSFEKKKGLKYGKIVVLDEVAEREGVTNYKVLREIKDEGADYMKLGGILVVPEMYKEIKEELKIIKTLGEAQSYFKSLGVRDFIQVLESFGYQIEWAKPRKSSRLYRL